MISIYRIYNEEGCSYVGSTSKNPWVRFMEHKYGFTGGNMSCSSYDLFAKGGEILFECLELCYPEERYEYERYWIRQYADNTVNRYLINDIDYENYQKNYQMKNKARLNEKVKCECGCEVSRKGISTHKKRPLHKKRMLLLKKNLIGQK